MRQEINLLSKLPRGKRNVNARAEAKTDEIIAISRQYGELYFDDGVSVTGPSLRQSISCTVTPAGVRLSFGPRQGKWRPWWKARRPSTKQRSPASLHR